MEATEGAHEPHLLGLAGRADGAEQRVLWPPGPSMRTSCFSARATAASPTTRLGGGVHLQQPSLQVGRLRPRAAKPLAQGPTASLKVSLRPDVREEHRAPDRPNGPVAPPPRSCPGALGGRLGGRGSFPAVWCLGAPFSCSPKPRQPHRPQGEVRTWEFSYLCPAGCVLCCGPTKVSKLRDELADFCLRWLGCPVAGRPVALAFSAAPGPWILWQAGPSGQRCEMQG